LGEDEGVTAVCHWYSFSRYRIVKAYFDLGWSGVSFFAECQHVAVGDVFACDPAGGRPVAIVWRGVVLANETAVIGQ